MDVMKIEFLIKKWRDQSRRLDEGAIKERGVNNPGSLLAQEASGMSCALRGCAEELEKALKHGGNYELQ